MDLSPYKQQLQKAVDYLEKELKSLQVGRASTWLVENIDVELSYWGSLKIPQVWHVTIVDAQTIKIETWDKWELKSVEKAIYDANIGLTPKNEWAYIMITIPPLNQERRQEIAKQVKAMWEDCKARIRVIRQDAMKDTKKQMDDKLIWEDQHKTNEKEIDSMIKNTNDNIDSIIKTKSEDVMKV